MEVKESKDAKLFRCIFIRLLLPDLKPYLKISIVLVNKNGGAFIRQCLNSIIHQDYPNLELIVVDGASSDESVTIIEEFQDHVNYFISEPDQGQYHAVQKGFDQSTGEIMAWINSDDMYLPGAFKTISALFTKFKEADWIMGIPGEIDRNNALFRRISIPWARWSKWRYYSYDFQFIQQESCFWRRTLWEKAGSRMNVEVKLAGDMDLWLRFFRHAELYTTIHCLGAFRQHSFEQRSRIGREEYLLECKNLIDAERKKLPVAAHLKASALRVFGPLIWPLHYYEIPVLKFIFHKLYKLPALINYNVSSFDHEKSEATMKLPPLFLGKTNITRESFQKKSV